MTIIFCYASNLVISIYRDNGLNRKKRYRRVSKRKKNIDNVQRTVTSVH